MWEIWDWKKIMKMNFQPTTQSLKRSLRKWIMLIESEWKIHTENRILVVVTCLAFFRNLKKSCITNVLHSFIHIHTHIHPVVIINTRKCYVYTKLYKTQFFVVILWISKTEKYLPYPKVSTQWNFFLLKTTPITCFSNIRLKISALNSSNHNPFNILSPWSHPSMYWNLRTS